MADVDLVVAVSDSGIQKAITDLENLQSAGQNTAGALRRLETASQSLNAIMRTGLGQLGGRDAMQGAPEAIDATTLALRKQEEEYTRLAKMQVGATARERLTTFGNGSFNKGMATAAQMEARAEAESATAIRDKMTVEREDMQLQQARTTALNAQKQVAVARWERELAAMTPVEAASARLMHATQELATATRMANVANERVGSNPTAANYDLQTQAAQRQAAAIRGLTVAQREFAQAQEQAAAVGKTAANETGTRDETNAFQSSYSYFIIAGLAQRAAQGLRDMGVASVSASAQMDRSFADVNRTFDGTSIQLDALRTKLLELSTTTPISFSDLSQIAAMGNQLGIASGDIQSFTKTISQYSAISGQTAEDSATAFGKISNLTGLAASQYSNLASSIEYTARTSVATEATISSTAEEITALASGAGFSAQAIVGLSGALSSLSIPPERARGALSLYFGALNKAVAEGGPKLEAFATLANMSQESISKLVEENKGQEVFTAFISGLSQLNSVAKTSALDTLGLSTIRVDQTMRALSQNVPLLTSAFAGADSAFKSDTELARQYGIIQDQLASKFVEFQNQVQNAAGALGNDLGGAVLWIITAVAGLVQGFAAFANSPFGRVVLVIAGAVGALAFAIASLVGILALAKASLVVTKFAFTGLSEGLNSNSPALTRFVAGMLRMNIANAETTASTTAASGATKVFSSSVKEGSIAAGAGAAANGTLAVSEEAVGAGGRAAAAGLTVMKVALWSTGIGLAVTLIGSLIAGLAGTADQAKLTAGDVAGLDDAIKADTATYQKTGVAIQTYTAKLPPATEEQKRAAQAAKNLADVLGTEVPAGAEKAGKAVEKVAAGKNVMEAFRKSIGDKAKDIISDSNFANAWGALGINIDDAIAAGLKAGGSEDKVRKALLGQISGLQSQIFFPMDSMTPMTTYTDKNGKDITEQVFQISRLIPTLASVGTSMKGATNANFVLNGSLKATANSAKGVDAGFSGATSSLSDYQDSVQKGLGSFTAFKEILKGVQDAQDNANKRKGPDATNTDLINARAFGKDLATANAQAVTFFNGLQTMAQNGRTSFATQLGELGPDAQLILADALKLNSTDQDKLEADARFAAFLASDAFKAALKTEMSNSDDAYAQIFSVTHSLDSVKQYIAAQISGTATEWERQWDVAHPKFPLNVTPALTNPTAGDLDAFSKLLSNEITISPAFSPSPDPMAPLVKQYRDQLTNAGINLPATLDGEALSTSLAYWLAHENATPEQIASALNTDGLSGALDTWRRTHGTVSVTVQGHWSIAPLSSQFWVDPRQQKAKGGEIAGFAGGGTWGEFSGPGSGTSDSLLARVSAGEYINTAEATRFWGTDFFDSLNRKMLPTSFLNMLGAAAVSGNQGPTHVANVQVVQNNPLTRDPLKQLRQDSEMVASGIWG